MPVTLRYSGDPASTWVKAAVFASVEDAVAQAVHDKMVLGRHPQDIIDGRHDFPHDVDKPKILVTEDDFSKKFKGKKRPNQYTDQDMEAEIA